MALHAVPAYRASIPTCFLPTRFIQLYFPTMSPILNGGMCTKSVGMRTTLVDVY